MTAWIVLAALVIAVSLASLMTSVYAFCCAQRTAQNAAAELANARQEYADAIEIMRKEIETIAAGLRDSPRQMNLDPLPGTPKPGMNLSRRSQALRLRRKGDSPQKIAETLDMPRQEVDLLLKVHEIVLNNV